MRTALRGSGGGASLFQIRKAHLSVGIKKALIGDTLQSPRWSFSRTRRSRQTFGHPYGKIQFSKPLSGKAEGYLAVRSLLIDPHQLVNASIPAHLPWAPVPACNVKAEESQASYTRRISMFHCSAGPGCDLMLSCVSA